MVVHITLNIFFPHNEGLSILTNVFVLKLAWYFTEWGTFGYKTLQASSFCLFEWGGEKEALLESRQTFEVAAAQTYGCVKQVYSSASTRYLINRWSPSILQWQVLGYLAIIPEARMGSESIAHETEGRLGYWLSGYEGERNNCFSKIQLVGQNYWDKTASASKTRFIRHCFGLQSRRFPQVVGYNI